MRGDGLRCRRGDEVIAVSTASSGARSVLLRGKEIICVLPYYLLKISFALGQGLIYCPVGFLVAWYPHKFEEIPGS